MNGNNISGINWNNLIDNFFMENIKSDMIFCDAGSCKGDVTDFFSKVSSDPLNNIYAFDINPNNPHLKGCIFNMKAISDFDGIEKVYSAGNDWMGNILGHNDEYLPTDIVISEVESIRLDTFFRDKKVDCLKMDIEGAELKALKGGLNTIKNCSVILIECHLDNDWVEIYDILESIGLDFYQLSSNKRIERRIEDNMNGVRPYQIYYKK